MKKKLIILFILVLTKSLFADEKILDDFISKINKENTWLPVEYLEVIKSENRDTMKMILLTYNYEKEWDEVDNM